MCPILLGAEISVNDGLERIDHKIQIPSALTVTKFGEWVVFLDAVRTHVGQADDDGLYAFAAQCFQRFIDFPLGTGKSGATIKQILAVVHINDRVTNIGLVIRWR